MLSFLNLSMILRGLLTSKRDSSWSGNRDDQTGKMMLFRRIISSALLFFAIASISEAQTISGFVREEATGEPLSYTNVFIKETFLGSATNVEGYYVITGIEPGDYEVAASIIGYDMKTVKVSLAEGENIRIDFRLQTAVVAGEEINVTAERQKFREMVQPSTITLDMREIQVAPAFVEADVFRTLQLLPGVQTLNDFSSALYVRGSTPDQNLIMLDGITVYHPFHLGGVFSTFNTDAIKEADFHAGGFPARYGGRMGSILNVINREGNTEEYRGTANISMISAKGMVEGPLPKWGGVKGSFMLAGRRTYFDTVVDLVARSMGANTNAAEWVGFPYHFYDMEGKLNLELAENHRVTLSVFYGDDVLDVHFSDSETYSEPDYTEEYHQEGLFNWKWGNFTNSITWRWIPSPKIVVKTFAASSRFRFWIDIDSKDRGHFREGEEEWNWRNEFLFDAFDVVNDRTIQSEVVWQPSSSHTVMTGFSHKALSFHVGMIFEWGSLDEGELFQTFSDTSLWMVTKPFEQALYLQDKWYISPRITTEIGLRISRYSLHDGVYPEPRFGVKFALTDNLSLKGNFGRYRQFLTMVDPRDINLMFLDIWLGVPQDREAPRSDHAIVGLEYLTDRNILFRLEGYYKDFDNLMTLKRGDLFSEREDIPLFNPFNEFHDADAYAYGVEALIRKTGGKVRGWIGYTFARTKWRTEVEDWYYPKYDRAHTVNVVADFKASAKYHLSTAIQYSTGAPFTPITGRYDRWIDQSQWGERDQWWYADSQYLFGKRNSDRYPSYFRWDVSVIRNKPFFGIEREKYLQIINLTNHLNHLFFIYRTQYSRRSGEQLGVQRRAFPMFPFLVTYGWRFKF